MQKIIFKILQVVSLIIAVTTVVTSLFTKNNSVGILLANYAFYILIVLIVVKSLYFILKKSNYTQILFILKFFVNNQRSIGLITFNFVIAHVICQIIGFLNSMNFQYLAYGSGLLPISILLFLEFTSFKVGQNMVTNWKKKHSIIWVVIALILGHIYIVSHELINYLVFTVFIYLVILVEYSFVKKRGVTHLKLFTFGVIVSILFIFIVEFIN